MFRLHHNGYVTMDLDRMAGLLEKRFGYVRESAVIHDPSDLVASAKGWGERPGDYTAHPDVRDLWGGKLVACSRITGHYFRCDFT